MNNINGILAAALILIILDIFSGIIKGFANKNFSSEKMRIGFWHKMASILLLATGYTISICGLFINELPAYLQGVSPMVSLYVIFMELTSIAENITEVNPELSLNDIITIFKDGKD